MKHKIKYLTNQAGTSFIEIIVVAVIGVFLLGASIATFLKQQDLYADQNDKTYIISQGRQAIKDLARELREAGYGLPPGQGIITAGADTVVFRANLEDVSTRITADINSGDSTLTVNDVTGFSNNDRIAVYHAFDSAKQNEIDETINSITGNVITIQTSYTNTYPSDQGTVVNKYNLVTLALDNGNSRVTKTIDAGAAIPLIADVENNGLSFVYKDKAGAVTATLADIRKIEITLSLKDPDNSGAVIEFKTDVNVRNMGA